MATCSPILTMPAAQLPSAALGTIEVRRGVPRAVNSASTSDRETQHTGPSASSVITLQGKRVNRNVDGGSTKKPTVGIWVRQGESGCGRTASAAAQRS